MISCVICILGLLIVYDTILGELRSPTAGDNNKAADGCIRGLLEKPLHIDVTISIPTIYPT